MTNLNYIIIDVREPFEFNMGNVEGSINIPSDSLMAGTPEMKDIPKDANIIVYCRSGSRSAIAIQIFQSLGFTNLINGINKEMVRQNFGFK